MDVLVTKAARQRGFSLVEILVVLVIMGLLISIVAPTVLNTADDARVKKVYAVFGKAELAEQEIFTGKHSFHGKGGLPFLAKRL